MKTVMGCSAVALLLLAMPAAARSQTTIEPNKLTVAVKRPPLRLNDQQRGAIQEGLALAHTEQKTPPNFEAKVGAKIPLSMKIDVMPARLVERAPSLQPYGYAKLAKQVLVIDPMQKTIVAVIPRQSPSSGKAETPADWAKTRGRELTGQAPEPPAGDAPAQEPAGDSGDVKNGNEAPTTGK